MKQKSISLLTYLFLWVVLFPPVTRAQYNDIVGIVTSNIQYTTIRFLHPSYYITTAINVFLGASGVLSFIFLLWGGTHWITAGGDKDAIEKARKKIIGALIGLSVVFSAYSIIFIIRVLFNVDLIGFNLSRIGT